MASLKGGRLKSSSGLTIETVRADELMGTVDSLIVAGSFAAPAALVDPNFAEQCTALGSRAARVSPSATVRSTEPVEHALRLISDDSAADHRVATIAAQAGLSRRHLSCLFKAETGTTVANHVEQTRIEQAALLLESTQLDHTTIARQVGFSSGEVMRQVFNRERETTPTKHREHFSQPG